jgi:hypothetical protein
MGVSNAGVVELREGVGFFALPGGDEVCRSGTIEACRVQKGNGLAGNVDRVADSRGGPAALPSDRAAGVVAAARRAALKAKGLLATGRGMSGTRRRASVGGGAATTREGGGRRSDGTEAALPAASTMNAATCSKRGKLRVPTFLRLAVGILSKRGGVLPKVDRGAGHHRGKLAARAVRGILFRPLARVVAVTSGDDKNLKRGHRSEVVARGVRREVSKTINNVGRRCRSRLELLVGETTQAATVAAVFLEVIAETLGPALVQDRVGLGGR